MKDARHGILHFVLYTFVKKCLLSSFEKERMKAVSKLCIIPVMLAISFSLFGTITEAEVISALSFGKTDVSDVNQENRVVFSRGSVKASLQSVRKTPADVPQIQRTVLPSFREKIDLVNLSPQNVIPVTVDKLGRVWGIAMYPPADPAASAEVYVIDPSKENNWGRVLEQISGRTINAVYCSKKSGSIFLAVDHGIYRVILTAQGYSNLPEPVLTLNNVARVWSFAEAADGRLWISEYGKHSIDGKDDLAAIRIYKSDLQGKPGSFMEIFNFRKDLPQYYHARLHLHKIVWDEVNDTLYIANGDRDPNYIFKSVGGKGGNWTRIIGPVGFKDRLQPTSAIPTNTGNIVWGDDALDPGFWIHDVVSDYFTKVGFDTEIKIGKTNIFSMTAIRNVIYAPMVSNGLQNAAFVIAPADDPRVFRFMDYYPVKEKHRKYVGWRYVTAVANDGYIWAGFVDDDKGIYRTAKYRPMKFTVRRGVSIDQGIRNIIADPSFNKGVGWLSYLKYFTLPRGGMLDDAVGLVRELSQRYSYRSSGKPSVLNFWAKRGTSKAGIQMIFRDIQSPTPYFMYEIGEQRLGNTWSNFTVEIPGNWAGNKQLSFRLAPAESGYYLSGYHYIDNVQLNESSRLRVTVAQDYREPDRLETHLARALVAPFTVWGVVDLKYPIRVPSEKYVIWEACGEADTCLSAVVHRGQMKLASSIEGELMKTSAGLPYQMLNNTHGDVLYWAISLDEHASARLLLATSRSDLEVVDGTVNLPRLMTIVDGGGINGTGKEIGGVIVKREICDRVLSPDEIVKKWSQL